MNACSKVFTGNIYGNHVVSCVGIIGIKHRYNVVRDTLVDICFWSRISAEKEVDIKLGGGWSSPLTQSRMVDFVPGRVVIDAAHQKDAVTLLKRIRKSSVTQDIRARADVHNYNRISFTIAKRVRDHLVSRLPKGCSRAWYLDDGTIVGDTLVVDKVLDLITEDGPRCGLHLNVDKIELFWPNEDPRSRLEGVFPPNISRPLHGVKLFGGPVSMDADFSSALVMKRVSKTIGLLDAVAKINDPQSQLSFDMALHSALERNVTASGPGFGDWQWRLDTLPFFIRGTWHLFSRYNFTGVAKDAQSSFSLSPRHMALWQSQREDHTTDWLRDTYGDHVLSCAGIIGIKHRHNTVHDTLVDICFRSGISTGKEVDIRFGGGSSPLMQTEMVDFVSGRAVLEAAQRKHAKYEAKCADIGYGFLPFSFSSLGELEKDAVTLMKRI
uniref:Uncharacterized protein n=1 Tax=Tanacetum cinerariifolium TaxID=118510 RepID=A0A6L2M8S0_TANCI|nr:hypothetical protein [Tanacetum cinerariifolium]